MKNIYLTKAQELNLKYAGLDLGDETEEFEKFFDQYMNEWDVEEEDREEYKKMIESNKPAFDWGVVECDGVTYFIDYVA